MLPNSFLCVKCSYAFINDNYAFVLVNGNCASGILTHGTLHTREGYIKYLCSMRSRRLLDAEHVLMYRYEDRTERIKTTTNLYGNKLGLMSHFEPWTDAEIIFWKLTPVENRG